MAILKIRHLIESIEGKLESKDFGRFYGDGLVINHSIPGVWKLTTFLLADENIGPIFNSQYEEDRIEIVTGNRFKISKALELNNKDDKRIIIQEEPNEAMVRDLKTPLYGYQVLDIMTKAKVYKGGISSPVVTSSLEDGIIAHVRTLEDVIKKIGFITIDFPYSNHMVQIFRANETDSEAYTIEQRIRIPKPPLDEDITDMVDTKNPFPDGFTLNGKSFFELVLKSRVKVRNGGYKYEVGIYDLVGNSIIDGLQTTDVNQLVAKHLHALHLLKEKLKGQYQQKHCEALYSYLFTRI